MVYGENIKWYKLGKKSTQAFREAVKKALDGKSVPEKLGHMAPYLCGHPEALDGFELSSIIEWLEDPEGPPPTDVYQALRAMLVECRGVLDDSDIESLAGSDEGDLI